MNEKSAQKCSSIGWEYMLILVGVVGFITMWAFQARFPEAKFGFSIADGPSVS